MRRLTPFVLVLMLSACGPSLPIEVSMREAPVDITYGQQGSPSPLPRAPGADPVPSTFPGFITPPVPIDPPPKKIDDVPPPPRCPQADPFDVPSREAGSAVDDLPDAGRFTFRRDGWVRTATFEQGEAAVADAPKVLLSTQIAREITNVRRLSADRIRYDVVQVEGELKTTTTYLIDNASGFFIERIVTEREDLPGGPAGTAGGGVESFNPQPPVKIATLPLSREPTEGYALTPQQRGHGVDPLTGISMEVYSRTLERERVDACGTLLDSWHINVTGTFERPGVRRFQLRGHFLFAPQMGGLIVGEQIELFGGKDDTRRIYFSQSSGTAINSATPGRRSS